MLLLQFSACFLWTMRLYGGLVETIAWLVGLLVLFFPLRVS